MKKILCVFIAFSLLVISGCSNGKAESTSTADQISAYISENVGYELFDLRVNESEGTGGYSVTVALNQSYKVDEFPSFVESVLAVSEAAANEYDVTIEKVNPTIYTGENEWLGWSSDTGSFYNQDEFLKEGLSLEDLKTEIAEITSEDHTPEENTDLSQFRDMIDSFQGEWEAAESKYGTLIVSGDTVNFIHEMTIGSRSSRDVNTFYLDVDENGALVVVNQHSQPRYNISIGEDGALAIESIISDEGPRVYEKISDNTNVPEEKVEPAIGMTESEVYNSTWGAPQKKNSTTTANGTHEQWVYDGGYIYLDDGIVTSIQEK